MGRSPVLLFLVLAAASLSACKREAPASDATPVPAVAPEAVPPATPATAASPAGQASFAGYGDMKLGSTIEEARAAWGGELSGAPSEGSTCHYLSPKWVRAPSDFAFMMEQGKFVRYDVGTDRETAPGGGKVGMRVDQLKTLYGDALQSAPHKYVQGGQNLSVAGMDTPPSKLVFEADAAGKVTAWRVGIAPQVDYVEGCS
jgi:hypothetical protein